jgi:hypothetical protein
MVSGISDREQGDSEVSSPEKYRMAPLTGDRWVSCRQTSEVASGQALEASQYRCTTTRDENVVVNAKDTGEVMGSWTKLKVGMHGKFTISEPITLGLEYQKSYTPDAAMGS